MHCLQPQRLKSMFLKKNSRWGCLKRTQSEEKKFQKTVDFNLWGNHATIRTYISNYIHFLPSFSSYWNEKKLVAGSIYRYINRVTKDRKTFEIPALLFSKQRHELGSRLILHQLVQLLFQNQRKESTEGLILHFKM